MIFGFPTNYDNTQVTVELRQIVESGVDVWDFEYPSFYEGIEKKAFEQKVLDHYWLRQIGQETVGRWLHCFRSRIRDIMPYYIQLYESERFMKEIEDPFATVDYTETFEEEHTGESSGTSTTPNTGTEEEGRIHTENHQHMFSNTPQGSISNLTQYMTEASVETADDNDDLTRTSEATSTGTATGTERGTVRHTLTKKGAMGVTTFGHDMIEYRQSFLNIDLMVINELKDLFLQVY